MNNNKLFVGALLGAAALAVYLHLKKMKKDKAASEKLLSESQIKAVVVEETAKAKAPFTDAFLKDYDVVVPPVKVRAAVKAKSEELRKGRFAMMPDNVVKPLKLEDI
jgi:hypothetical protein